ncbi:MAG: hypothetical protein KKC68_04250 [Candidatus Thermoplasmatota archaeon]|nr:hypothetical protein [Candidatus Thermoplasmatota archaeon]MBU1940963.1 hypothetical protein [Candidatus Thermoplasmatota archaeon]
MMGSNAPTLYEKQILEKWMKQIRSGEVNPEVFGFSSDRDKAIETIKNRLTNPGRTGSFKG